MTSERAEVWAVTYGAVDGGSLCGLFSNRAAAVEALRHEVEWHKYEGMDFAYEVRADGPNEYVVGGPHEHWQAIRWHIHDTFSSWHSDDCGVCRPLADVHP